MYDDKKMTGKMPGKGCMPVDVGLVGLGKMGHGLALNMRDHGHRVVAFSRSAEKAAVLGKEGLEATAEVDAFAAKLGGRKIVWLMVPAGDAVDYFIEQVKPFLAPKDIIVDGGNAHYRDSRRRAANLSEEGFCFVDAGISGGPEGARKGACMMIGADRETYLYLEPLLVSLCLEGGCLHVGENGAGHYVKMIHNGIEYGMMQAIAEGFELMEHGPYALDYHRLAGLWNSGSIIQSKLIALTAELFAADPKLDGIGGVVGSSGTGLWTVQEALEKNVSLPVITQSLYARYRSAQQETFSGKVVAGLRHRFGGHETVKPE